VQLTQVGATCPSQTNDIATQVCVLLALLHV
jgi:hypothetical protein